MFGGWSQRGEPAVTGLFKFGGKRRAAHFAASPESRLRSGKRARSRYALAALVLDGATGPRLRHASVGGVATWRRQRLVHRYCARYRRRGKRHCRDTSPAPRRVWRPTTRHQNTPLRTGIHCQVVIVCARPWHKRGPREIAGKRPGAHWSCILWRGEKEGGRGVRLTDGGDGGDNLAELELVEDGGLTGGVETDHKDAWSCELLEGRRRLVQGPCRPR